MADDATYDVRVYKTEVYKGSKVTTYYVRWKVSNRQFREAFRTSALADSFRSELMTAMRGGQSFSTATGRPISSKHEEPEKPGLSWYALTLGYVAAKWPYASPNHRRGIAEALTDATEAMLASGDAPHARDEIRRVLLRWAYSDRMRGRKEPPDDMASVVRWLETGTIPVADLAAPGTGPARTRAMLDRISKKKDGTAAAANTANRKRMVLNNALQYAAETMRCLSTRSTPSNGPARARSRPSTRGR